MYTSSGAAEPKIYVQVDKQHQSDVQKALDSGLEVIEEYPAYLYGKATKPQFEGNENKSSPHYEIERPESSLH